VCCNNIRTKPTANSTADKIKKKKLMTINLNYRTQNQQKGP